MLSAIEQRSRFRIFDLNEKSNTSFILKALNQEYQYAIPLFVQVKDISTRKENKCQSISYTFPEFYKSYFQTNTFDVGISGLNSPSFSVEYHEMLKRVFEAITKYSQAVGTSTISWNHYSLQLASLSLLKFDPMFNTSVNLLISQAANPNSEVHQQLYNDFIQNYGTYYVSNVIVGGIAHLYTFVRESYHKNATFEEMTQQISLTAKHEEFTFHTESQTEEIYEKVTEKFKKNSYTISTFQPSLVTVNNQSMLQTWINNAGEKSIIINRTLSHIADLISSNNQVQEHLRRTIDFYLNNGFLPTLAQLNSRKKITRFYSSAPRSIRPIFGLDVVGCGYDLLTLQSRFCILDISNSSQNELWTDPYNQSLSYSLPNGFFATNTPESLAMVIWEQHGFLSRKRVERSTRELYRRFYQDYYNLALRLKQIGWYTLSVSIFPYPKLNPLATTLFASLPLAFDSKNISVWETFITSFGTHVVVASQMGGQVWAETWFDKCLTYEQTETWITEQVTGSFLDFVDDASTTQEHQRKVDERFKQFSSYSSQLLGGTESIEPEKWEEWAPTVKNNPKPISYRLVPLYELLPEGNQRSALQAAIEYISEKAELENEKYINQLESVRGPPPTKCSRNRVRRAVSNATNLSQSNDAAIRKALCPYVGYNGSICAGATGKANFIPVYRRLPVGVGMTIDIIKGTLLLPPIDFTHDNTTYWQDPLTNEIYWYPREISVLPVEQNANEPVARTFLTASELENHWKYGQTRGDWLGGELGHSKSILDIQARFFADNQAIAITQKPYALYRLKVEVLKLNVYAKNAVNALPKVYNEMIYESFLRNWGTHIVLKSIVGGMHEQQVLFKDCVFSFNGAITPENLDQYLKQDILAETLGNSFYAERRKISIDHKLGGNPSLSNVTAWQSSLGANPALLKIEQFTPWYEIVEDPDVKANLIRIIKNRTDTYEQTRIQEETQIMKQRANAHILSLQASVGFLNGDTCETTTPVTLGSVAKCSGECSTGLKLRSLSGGRYDRPLLYVRDPATGFVQARVRFQNGGMHEQQVLFKDCVFSFNGAVTPENLDQYLKQDILAETLGNSFYAERRKISIDHKLGGKPSLSNVTAWQFSLGANPALLKIEQFTPWYEIVEDPDVKANLIRIIKNRTDTYEQKRIQEETQIMKQRANARILSLQASVGFLNGDTCEITTPVTLGSVANCSSECSVGLKLRSLSGGLYDRPLLYVRDPVTGFVQARVRFQNGTVVDGARISVGCSSISTSSMTTQVTNICVGCTLAKSNTFHIGCNTDDFITYCLEIHRSSGKVILRQAGSNSIYNHEEISCEFSKAELDLTKLELIHLTAGAQKAAVRNLIVLSHPSHSKGPSEDNNGDSSSLKPCPDNVNCLLQYTTDGSETRHNSKFSHPCRFSELCRNKEPHLTHDSHPSPLCSYDKNCNKLTDPIRRAEYRHTNLPDFLVPCRLQKKCTDKSNEHRIKYSHGEKFLGKYQYQHQKAFWNDFPSGRMNKKGFIKYYEEIKDEKDRANILCDHVFAVFDKNHDGTIDFHEFLLAIATGSPADLDSHLNYVFEMCDVSGDGEMDLQELAAFLKASLTIAGKLDKTDPDYPKELAIGVFNTLGINEGNKLNKAQFIKGCKKDPGLRELFGGGH
ncbi:unnamed protein product [Rotaria sp. Silwood1]|nr:unnamed protein product [Rotaria sp. Silwood1]